MLKNTKPKQFNNIQLSIQSRGESDWVALVWVGPENVSAINYFTPDTDDCYSAGSLTLLCSALLMMMLVMCIAADRVRGANGQQELLIKIKRHSQHFLTSCPEPLLQNIVYIPDRDDR